MTQQQLRTITTINDQLASDRAAAELSSRPALTPEQIEANVIIAVQVKIDEGNMDAARQLWRTYREGK